ncbi:MAG: GH3 auxin-responsive promoter family protein, partial [Chloroflexota bacterium]
MASSVDVWRHGSREEIWNHFCGFLDLTVPEFMRMQDRLLMEHIGLLAKSELGKVLMGDKVPANPQEFRQIVPLTRYSFYDPILSEKRDDILPVKPAVWARTSGIGGIPKWVPYTPGQHEAIGHIG